MSKQNSVTIHKLGDTDYTLIAGSPVGTFTKFKTLESAVQGAVELLENPDMLETETMQVGTYYFPNANMNDLELPYLQSRRHFLKYEDYIFRIVNNWPGLTVFKPTDRSQNGGQPLSVETLSTRIRICMQSLVQHQHDSKIPFAKFIQIVDDIVVSTAANPGCVTCGPADLVRKKVPLGQPVEVDITQVVPKVNLLEPEHDLIKAVLVMHHHRILTEPSIITTQVSHSYINDMKLLYDVEVQQVGDTFTIL